MHHRAAARRVDGRWLRAGSPQDLPKQLIPFDDPLPRSCSIARSAGRRTGGYMLWSCSTPADDEVSQRQESEAGAGMWVGRAESWRRAFAPREVWRNNVFGVAVPRLP